MFTAAVPGYKLKVALAERSMSVTDFTKKVKKSRFTIHLWIKQDTLKPKVIAMIDKAFGGDAWRGGHKEIREDDLLQQLSDHKARLAALETRMELLEKQPVLRLEVSRLTRTPGQDPRHDQVLPPERPHRPRRR